MKKKKIVIVGGGSAGWMTAAGLSQFLPKMQFEITQIESNMIGTVGVGEATIPHIRQFNQMLGIDENEFMRATGATYKLAIQFTGWGSKDSSYMHPFGHSGHDINGINFHHYWLHLQQQQGLKLAEFDQYSIAVVAAQKKKFQYQQQNQNALLDDYSYAFHLDATLYAKYLKSYSIKRGVRTIEGKVTVVNLADDSGDIQSVQLESGQKIEGDLFIDCSGFRGLLIEEALKTGYQDWTHWLPCNKALAVASEKTIDPPPYTRSAAKKVGWQWRVPVQHRTGNGLVFCGDYLSDDEAHAILLDGLEEPALSDPRLLRFTTGKRNKSWSKNCIAIGLSAGFLEPLESTSLYLTQIAIQKLIEFFPADKINDVERNAFNRHLDTEYERVRDFLILHYKLNRRNDSEFWRYCQNMPIPDSLQQQMTLFQHSAHISTYRQGLFMPASWLAVYLGQDSLPLHYDPRVLTYPVEKLQYYLNKMAEQVSQTASEMQNHNIAIQNIQRIGFSAYPNAALSLYGGRI
ncbi:tryptophan halogenase family protein [Paraglaciecola sp. L3A3]|uniref:tryptophan halogenase family protein n=1 Tax=Paraglaciecola sp. L3A3 TaxID=2686358 RepID=UPI00131E368F|nr:tryptophan halogenase family protein [Paraglaciecola sp. L3A3]